MSELIVQVYNQPILSTLNMFPRNTASIHEIDLGLVMQFHFQIVALNKVPPSPSHSLIVQPRGSSHSANETNEIT